MEFKDVFTELLNESGMSQAEFSRRSGLISSYVSQLKNGKTPDPSFAKVCLIADTFGVSIDRIYEMSMQDKPKEPVANEYKLTKDEKSLIDTYRGLDKQDKNVSMRVLSALNQTKEKSE